MGIVDTIRQVISVHRSSEGWSLPRVIRHVLYWVFWIVFYGSLNNSYSDPSMTTGNWYVLEVLLLLAKIPLVYTAAYWLFPNFFIKKKYVQFVFGIFLLAFLALCIALLVNRIYPMPWQPTSFFYEDKVGFASLNTKTIFRYVDMVYTCLPFLIIKSLQRQVQQNSTNAELLNQKKEAELTSLKNQLQPHFLFNTLNNIYGQILAKDDNAGDAVVKLSNMLSYMLYDCEKEYVSIESEVDNIRDYIQLEQMRYGDSCQVDLEVVGKVSDKMIAPLLLIPFVENAFKHGIGSMRDGGWIKIYLEVGDEELVFVVENNYITQQNDIHDLKSGIGLNNVQKRLALLHPNSHSLEVVAEPTFMTHLKIIL